MSDDDFGIRNSYQGKVIDLAERRIALRKKSWVRYGSSDGCGHKRIVLDENGGTVDCRDCGKSLSPFWAFWDYLDKLSEWRDELKGKHEDLVALQDKTLSLRAALDVQRQWRAIKSQPACPHCREAILASDRFGTAYESRAEIMDKRKAAAKSVQP